MLAVPLGDASRRTTSFPIVTTSIVVANVLVFLLELSGGDTFVARWSVIPADIVAGRHWITLLTAMFMHGSWSHIIGNMLFLWVFGPEVEDLMKPRRFLGFYLLGGLIATLSQVVVAPTSTVPNLGASGAIAAVMGGFLVTYPRDRIRSLLVIFVFVRVTYIPAVVLIGVWFISQFLSLGAVTEQAAGGVAYAAHIGGFIFGAVMARPFESRGRVDLRERYS